MCTVERLLRIIVPEIHRCHMISRLCIEATGAWRARRLAAASDWDLDWYRNNGPCHWRLCLLFGAERPTTRACHSFDCLCLSLPIKNQEEGSLLLSFRLQF
jgi:hypothetical protein